MAKPCPITAEQFEQSAPTLTVEIDGQKFKVPPKDVEDGKSLGYFLNAKMHVTVNGVDVPCQVGLNITCIGSKHRD